MKININDYFNKNLRPLIVAEISANHCGSKSLFLNQLYQLLKMVLIDKNTNLRARRYYN